jgi:hypothetical protein
LHSCCCKVIPQGYFRYGWVHFIPCASSTILTYIVIQLPQCLTISA